MTRRTRSLFGYCLPDALLREFEALEFSLRDPQRPSWDHFDAYSDEDLFVAPCIAEPRKRLAEIHDVIFGRNEGAALPVSAQLATGLTVLASNSHPGFVMNEADLEPGAIEAAQSLVSRLLVAHPVLMHPSLKIEIRLPAIKGYGSVPHALALAVNARFPMGRDGFTAAQLSAFVGHPCVQMGLAFRHPAGATILRLIEHRTPLDAGLRSTGDRCALVGSLFELSERSRALPADARALPEDLAKQLREPATWDEALASGTLQALGLWQTDLHDRSTKESSFPEFLDGVKGHMTPTLRDAVLDGFVNGGFSRARSMRSRLTAESTTSNLRCLTEGLVRIDACASPSQAAELLRARLSRFPPPDVSLESAMAFLKTMADYGAPVGQAHFTWFDSVAQKEVSPFDATAGLATEAEHVWGRALRIQAAENLMLAEIARVDARTSSKQVRPGQPRRAGRAL